MFVTAVLIFVSQAYAKGAVFKNKIRSFQF